MGDEKESAAKAHLGIPEAVFVEDVDKYMKEHEPATAEDMLKKLDENYQKYKLMEVNLTEKKRRLKQQIPDLKDTLDILKHLHSKKDSTKPMATKFLLSGALHAKATVPPTDQVCLWLGANVMLTYSTQEALDLISKNYTTAVKNLAAVNGDLGFLRDQFTTTEVTMARLYNWDVKQRRLAKEKDETAK
ncbi:unnamed protein product [Clavelina lepadiformis]|uniref:Prefoldin subunit 3 n=1 Tax=Clavelina lepadiformis TaxID=159417 RepID=A0ABP0EZL6_CLALP